MNTRENRDRDAEAVFRTMRDMILEAKPEEVKELAKEAGMDAKQLATVGRTAVASALRQFTDSKHQADNIVILHKGFSSLIVMLRRRDGLDEHEVALKAQVDETEIRRIEYDETYLPSPRTIFRLEQAFSLPKGVLAKLSGAITATSPVMEDEVIRFAANAKTIGRLTKAERQLLNAFVKFLAEQP